MCNRFQWISRKQKPLLAHNKKVHQLCGFSSFGSVIPFDGLKSKEEWKAIQNGKREGSNDGRKSPSCSIKEMKASGVIKKDPNSKAIEVGKSMSYKDVVVSASPYSIVREVQKSC